MFHLDNTSGVPEMPEPKDTQTISPRWFGESQEQGGISWPGADWFNTVQAELLNLLAAAGLTPDKKSYDQLSKAIPVLGDAIIRADLQSEELPGAKIVSLLYGTVYDAIRYITPEMFGAIADGVTNNDAAFTEINSFVQDNGSCILYLSGGSYALTQWDILSN